MKEFKGTPGSWVYDDFRRAIGVVSNDDDQSFGMVCGEVAWVEFIGKGVETHNANLIAAAPDLLNALQDMLSGWKYIREVHGDLYGIGWDRAQESAIKAIEKALGE